MAIGIPNVFIVAANVPFTSNVTLTTVGLNSPIAAGQTQNLRFWVPFSVGATGGIRFQLVVPAGGTIFLATNKIFNTVAPLTTISVQTSSAVTTNALANAGNHWIEVEATIVNGATAGNVDLQIAQNTSDVLTLTVLRGGFCRLVKL